MNPPELSKSFLTKNVKMILRMLEAEGHSAYVVGGCVRDEVMGYSREDFLAKGGDFDITTSASVPQMKKLFSSYKQILDGEEFGTVKVMVRGRIYEITTYRVDGAYRDGRRPEEVVFTDDVEKDLSRRDFTINAMARDIAGNLIDPYGGVDDLHKQVVRTVGDPYQRFSEDYLRMLRCIRFATVLNFHIDVETSAAIKDIQQEEPHIFRDSVSTERLRTEMEKIMRVDPHRGLQLLADHLLLETVTPLTPDRLEQTLVNLEHAETNWMVNMSLLGQGINDDPIQSALVMDNYLKSLATATKDREHIVTLVTHHQVPERILEDKASDITTKLWLEDIVKGYRKEDTHLTSLLADLFAVYRANAYRRYGNDEVEFRKAMDMLSQLRSRLEPIFHRLISDKEELYIDGNDVVKLGLKGQEIAMMLEEVRLYHPKSRKEAMEFMHRLLHNQDAVEPAVIAEDIGAYEDEPVVSRVRKRREKLFRR